MKDACQAYLVARRWPEGVRCPVVAILVPMTSSPTSGTGNAGADDIHVTIATLTSSSSTKISSVNLIGDVFSAVTS
jgi:hypothetical protein